MLELSVIVPIYNTEKYLEKCLDSIINQKLESIEILLINDGSPDNSQEIIDRYVEKYPNICKSFIQKNSGQASARNVGIKNAKGEFLAFVDSDDYLEEEAYGKIIEKAKKEDLDIVCFDFFEVRENERKEISHYFCNTKNLVKRYIVSESSPWNKIIKRKLLVDNNILFLENKIYEDLATIPTLGKYTNKIDFIEDRVYDYVIRENSTMRYSKYNSKLEDIFMVVNKLYEDFINTEYYEELEYIYIEHLLHAASLRFFNYKEGIENIYKISKIMKEKFPKWRKNKYYKEQDWKYKLVCNLFYSKKIKLLKKILGGINA